MVEHPTASNPLDGLRSTIHTMRAESPDSHGFHSTLFHSNETPLRLVCCRCQLLSEWECLPYSPFNSNLLFGVARRFYKHTQPIRHPLIRCALLCAVWMGCWLCEKRLRVSHKRIAFGFPMFLFALDVSATAAAAAASSRANDDVVCQPRAHIHI